MTVQEGDELTFTATADDIDGDDLTYVLTPLPQGSSFDGASRQFSWQPPKGSRRGPPTAFAPLLAFLRPPSKLVAQSTTTKKIKTTIDALTLTPYSADIKSKYRPHVGGRESL
jgi:hypothetical protein